MPGRGYIPSRAMPRMPMIGARMMPFNNYPPMIGRARPPRVMNQPLPPTSIEVKKPVAIRPDVTEQYSTRELGEKLYPMVLHLTNPTIVGKITGMLLEMDKNEVITLINDENRLNVRVREAIEVLKKAWAHDANALSALP